MKLLRHLGFLLALCGASGIAATAFAADEAKPAEQKAVAKDLLLKGDAKCTGCHDESDEPVPTMLELHPSVLAIATTRHGVRGDSRAPTCTNCHGESDEHLHYKGKDKPPSPDRTFRKNTKTAVSDRNAACLSCHETDRNRTHWTGSQHDTEDIACTSCHQVHTKNDRVLNKVTQTEVCYSCHKTERAQSHKVSTHPLDAGKLACSSCHNPHGSAGPKLMKKNTVNETCHTCHAEKRGPFLFEHQPVTEDCLSCHTPHGSNISPLLKSRPPALCDECHDGPHQSANIFGPNIAGKKTNTGLTATGSGAGGRGCMNCHVQVHGSNSPAGGQLTR
jgi:DmsE family decaheme c-type cytochrome